MEIIVATFIVLAAIEGLIAIDFAVLLRGNRQRDSWQMRQTARRPRVTSTG
jgi:hypothetical protein